MWGRPAARDGTDALVETYPAAALFSWGIGHLEVCVFSYLAAELRSGDIAVIGADFYPNFFDQLLSPAEVEPLIAGYCAEVDLPTTAGEFRAEIEARLRQTAADVDAGYPANADLVIDEAGHPVLKRQRGKEHPAPWSPWPRRSRLGCRRSPCSTSPPGRRTGSVGTATSGRCRDRTRS